ARLRSHHRGDRQLRAGEAADERGPVETRRHERRVDRAAHRDPRTADRRQGRVDRDARHRRRPPGDRVGGADAAGHRLGPLRHDHAGDDVPVHRLLRRRRPGHGQHARVRRGGGVQRVPVHAGHGGGVREGGPVPQRAGHRRRDAQPDHRLQRPRELHPVRRRGGRGGAPAVGRPEARAGLRQPARRRQRVGDALLQARQPLPDRGVDAERPRPVHEDQGPRGVQVRGAAVRGADRGRDAQVRADGRRRQPDRAPPGEPADHRQRDGQAGPQAGEGVRQHRQVRQHVGGVDPDRAGRGVARRAHQAGRRAGVRRVRRGADVGERGRAGV
ncbi:MAG: 3-oxoacyl-[acyl-carrier-protein] synthase, KASIII, partial [uncultured Phycisphaerae bacterium]